MSGLGSTVDDEAGEIPGDIVINIIKSIEADEVLNPTRLDLVSVARNYMDTRNILKHDEDPSFIPLTYNVTAFVLLHLMEIIVEVSLTQAQSNGINMEDLEDENAAREFRGIVRRTLVDHVGNHCTTTLGPTAPPLLAAIRSITSMMSTEYKSPPATKKQQEAAQLVTDSEGVMVGTGKTAVMDEDWGNAFTRMFIALQGMSLQQHSALLRIQESVRRLCAAVVAPGKTKRLNYGLDDFMSTMSTVTTEDESDTPIFEKPGDTPQQARARQLLGVAIGDFGKPEELFQIASLFPQRIPNVHNLKNEEAMVEVVEEMAYITSSADSVQGAIWNQLTMICNVIYNMVEATVDMVGEQILMKEKATKRASKAKITTTEKGNSSGQRGSVAPSHKNSVISAISGSPTSNEQRKSNAKPFLPTSTKAKKPSASGASTKHLEKDVQQLTGMISELDDQIQEIEHESYEKDKQIAQLKLEIEEVQRKFRNSEQGKQATIKYFQSVQEQLTQQLEKLNAKPELNVQIQPIVATALSAANTPIALEDVEMEFQPGPISNKSATSILASRKSLPFVREQTTEQLAALLKQDSIAMGIGIHKPTVQEQAVQTVLKMIDLNEVLPEDMYAFEEPSSTRDSELESLPPLEEGSDDAALIAHHEAWINQQAYDHLTLQIRMKFVDHIFDLVIKSLQLVEDATEDLKEAREMERPDLMFVLHKCEGILTDMPDRLADIQRSQEHRRFRLSPTENVLLSRIHTRLMDSYHTLHNAMAGEDIPKQEEEEKDPSRRSSSTKESEESDIFDGTFNSQQIANVMALRKQMRLGTAHGGFNRQPAVYQKYLKQKRVIPEELLAEDPELKMIPRVKLHNLRILSDDENAHVQRSQYHDKVNHVTGRCRLEDEYSPAHADKIPAMSKRFTPYQQNLNRDLLEKVSEHLFHKEQKISTDDPTYVPWKQAALSHTTSMFLGKIRNLPPIQQKAVSVLCRMAVQDEKLLTTSSTEEEKVNADMLEVKMVDEPSQYEQSKYEVVHNNKNQRQTALHRHVFGASYDISNNNTASKERGKRKPMKIVFIKSPAGFRMPKKVAAEPFHLSSTITE